jgi:hypothetical protein
MKMNDIILVGLSEFRYLDDIHSQQVWQSKNARGHVSGIGNKTSKMPGENQLASINVFTLGKHNPFVNAASLTAKTQCKQMSRPACASCTFIGTGYDGNFHHIICS